MKLLSELNTALNDLWYTMYPTLCMACAKNPRIKEGIFCVHCLHAMPYSDHFKVADNKVVQKFYGRVPLHFGAAVLNFRPGGIVQKMMHHLKYERKREIAITMGEIAGDHCLTSSHFSMPDLMVPVPLHPSKEYVRGYNQSLVFGRGVQHVLNIPLSDDIVVKRTKTASQTGKSRTDRVNNVKSTFALNKAELIRDKHVMILDDVVTTGATIEAVAIRLKEGGARELSVLTIALAEG